MTVYAAVLGFARLCIDGSLGLDEAQRGPIERRVVANLAALAAGP